MAGDVICFAKTMTFLFKLKTISLLTYMLAVRYSQASYNVTMLLFLNTSCDGNVHDEIHKLLRQEIFPPKSEVINFRWFKANVTGIDRRQAGVLEALSFVENHSAADGAIFVDITRENLVFSSLLENSNILTAGLFQKEDILQTQETSGEFTRVTFSSIYHYATSAWKIIKKYRWRTICLIISASYEGKVFVDQMTEFAVKEKAEILKIVWLVDGTIGNGTTTELRDVIRQGSDVIVMHSRLGDEERFFELIQELGVSKHKTVWVVTDITTYVTTDTRNLPEGLLKISLKRPDQCLHYSVYDNAFHDALLLIQMSFEESVKQCYENTGVKNCSKGSHSKKIWQTAKRRMAQKSLLGKSALFDLNQTVNSKYSTFTIWNLKRDGLGVKNWFPVGMGASTGLAMETYTSPNGQSMAPVSEHPDLPIVHVVVNEYPPFVYKVDTIGEEGCVGRLVDCYQYARANTSAKKFCCFGASLEFLAFLQRDLSFEARIYFNPDGQFGVFNDSTGQWNGIVQELVNGKAMLSLEMGLNKRRAEVISFAHPTLPLELGVLLNKTEMLKDLSRDSWLHPFSTKLWLCLLGTACVVFITIWWLDRRSPQGNYRMLKGSGKDGFTLLDSISYIGGVSFGKDIGAERTPLSTSSRVVSYVYSLLALIMINTYCANLMAFLLEENVGSPITGLDDPKLTSEPPLFRVAAVRGSSEEDYFKNHVNSSFRKIYEVNLKEHTVPSLDEGVKHMLQGKIHGLIGDYLSLSQIANTDKSCSFKLLKGHSLESGYGFAVPKASPWLHEISQSVLIHQENGTVQSIVNQWFPKSVCIGIEHRKLESSDFVGLFWSVIIVSVFSLMALFAEMLTLFALVKFGKSLGPLGRFLKRFLFNVKRGEEDETLMHCPAGLMATVCDVTETQISYDNDGFVDICELQRKIACLR